jgi:DnaJ-class molecular chaperone
MTKVCPGCSGDGTVRVYNGTDSFGNDVSNDDTCPDCKGAGKVTVAPRPTLEGRVMAHLRELEAVPMCQRDQSWQKLYAETRSAVQAIKERARK